HADTPTASPAPCVLRMNSRRDVMMALSGSMEMQAYMPGKRTKPQNSGQHIGGNRSWKSPDTANAPRGPIDDRMVPGPHGGGAQESRRDHGADRRGGGARRCPPAGREQQSAHRAA